MDRYKKLVCILEQIFDELTIFEYVMSLQVERIRDNIFGIGICNQMVKKTIVDAWEWKS